MTPFDWEQSAYLGYMAERYEESCGNDLFGNPLNDDEEDNDDEDNSSNWPF